MTNRGHSPPAFIRTHNRKVQAALSPNEKKNDRIARIGARRAMKRMRELDLL